jgi:hypothetical protein
MIFQTPGGLPFDVPDEWWSFTDMADFKPPSKYYPYSHCKSETVEIISLSDIEPLRRDPGTPLFRKYRFVPVLFAFQSPWCALPPVELHPSAQGQYGYRIHNGCHRYYASVAVGYTEIPAIVFEPFFG